MSPGTSRTSIRTRRARWALRTGSMPRQENTNDCGAFVLAALNVLHRAFELGVEVDLATAFSGAVRNGNG